MSDPMWKRIAGIHSMENGDLAVVWLGHDKLDDSVHIIDCCIFHNEVPIVIAEGLNSRGRWIPIAWPKSCADMSEILLKRGCRMLYDPVPETKTYLAAANKELLERIRTRRIKTNIKMASWNDEYEKFKDSSGDASAYPLISATRNALTQLDYAKRQAKTTSKPNYPKVAMI